MTEFIDTFLSHDKLKALDVLCGVETVVVCGERDLVTPPRNSEVIAAALPSARSVVVAGAGHMVMLERPDVVNDLLSDLVDRVRRKAGARAGQA